MGRFCMLGRATRKSLLVTTALCAVFVLPSHAYANPQGGATTGGSAIIEQSGSATTIKQSSNRAIIRWDSFDVDTHEHVDFQQPSRSSITVNRIRDNKPSAINGRLTANGNIVLINPNGVVFGTTSTTDVGGLIATSSDLEDDNAFLQGGAAKFTKGGAADARIVNNGAITVRDAGLVGLVAPHVENNGIIQARMGRVQLASGDIHTIDFAGDGLIKLEVSDAIARQSVRNSGRIEAEGGDILLSAADARGVVDTLVTNSGHLSARAAGNKSGTIKILGQKIHVEDGASLDVSGHENAGTINIGGAYQGGDSLPAANMVHVGQNVRLDASSEIGDGGTIILWSTDATRFYGNADVSGTGKGGLIEVSGKNYLDYNGTVDLSGKTGGTLLLDPTNISISSAANSGVTGASPFSPTADDITSVLNVTTLQSALASGNVIVQTRATGAQAGNITVDAAITWTSGKTLTLDAHGGITVNQAITGANLSMIAGADIVLNANLVGTGTLDIQQRADNITFGIGNASTGTLQLNTTDLGRIANGWNDIFLGRQTATAAMDVRAATWSDNLTLRSGTGTITVNGIQNLGANNLSIITDGDIALALANALTGSGTLKITPGSIGTTIGLGGGAGIINLTAAEVGRITNGWNDIIIGRTDGTGTITSSTLTWNDNLTFQSGTGLINISGVQTLGTNDLTFITDGDITLGVSNALTGSGNLFFTPVSTSTSIGLADVGAINLTATEITRIRNGWASITFGRTDSTGDINVGTSTWNDYLTLQNKTGAMNINGTLTMAANNNLTIRTDSNIALTGSLVGSFTSSNPAILTIVQTSDDVSMGLGTGQAGTVNFDDTELSKIADGWSSRVFGRSDSTAALNIGAGTWVDPLTLQTGTGALNLNGALNMAANSLTLRTDSNVLITDTLTSTGTFALVQSTSGVSMGVGTGQAGTVHLDDAEYGYLGTTWGSRVFGRNDSTADLNFAGGTAPDPLTLRTGSGNLTIDGVLAMATNALTITTDSDLAINYDITGTGALTITGSNAATAIGIGTGQAGMLVLDDAELAHFGTTRSAITIGSLTATGDMNVGTRTWADPLTLRTGTGAMNINGNISMGGNALTLYTDSNIAINGNLAGTGTLTIAGAAAATTIGVGDGQGGTLHLADAELARIQNGWGSLAFGTTSTTGSMNIGAYTWNDSPTFRTTGTMNVNGAQNAQANNMFFYTNSNINIGANLAGTGALTISTISTATTMGVGSGQAGTLSIDDTELAYLVDGWSNIIFGSTSLDGTMNVAGRTWQDSVEFRTESGILNINGPQNVGANNLTIRTNTNLAINQILAGTGNIAIMTSATGAGFTMGIGDGQAGLLSLTNAELGYISDGWANILLGNPSTAAVMNVGAYTWNDSVTFRNAAAALNINGTQNVGANNMTLTSDGDINITSALNGSGILTIAPTAATTTMGIGTGQSGTLSLTNAELALFTNPSSNWSSIIFGTTVTTTGTYGAMNVGAYTWYDDITFRSNSSIININGNQTLGANSLTIQTNANPLINGNLSGSGTLTFLPMTAAGTMNLNGATTGLSLISTELDKIQDGWSEIIFGRSDATGAMGVSSRTWLDNVTFMTGTGVLTFGGANVGANNLTLATNSNLSLTGDLIGTGNLTIRNASGNTGIGVGDLQTGSLLLSNAELARFIDGWNKITIGSASSFGNINIGAYNWVNPMHFLTQSNISLNGVQTSNETAGTSLVFATIGGNFINNAGASAIDPGGGRYLVYSVAEANDTLNGLLRPTIVTDTPYVAYLPENVTEAGNVFIYAGTAARILNIQIDDLDKMYGDSLPTFTYTYLSGLQNSDLLADALTGATLTAAGANALDGAGTMRTISGMFTTALGYTVNVINGTLTVIKAMLTVEADSDTRVYGNANPSLTISYSGFKNGEDETDIDTLATASTLATLTSNVGTYAITASGAFDDNYDFIYTDGVLNITKATLTATVQNATREYGDANPGFTVTYTGFKNGENSGVIDTLATGSTTATATSNVGSYTISGGGGIDNNYNFTYVSGNLSVTKATLTATADNQSRAYGGANPALNITYTGFKNGETASVIDTLATGSTAATITSNVGTYGITAAGAVDNNYNFTYAGGTLTINKAVLTTTAQNDSREYGDANPAFTVAYTGFKNGETSAVIDTLATASSAANATSNVGTYAIAATGASDDNYSFSYVDGTLTVTKATLTATAQNGSREYGDANPAFTVAYTGFKNGETSAVIDTLATASSAANATS
ncbi:MAG: filamentous hemagglutinin N-terminal domain-containing protein, partial [Alphaproteobacteria bacterium]|nr:filamentous hemagglutinin N-terminal domain-containing protein [Alphaproteobacteria bacterium]